MAMAAFAAGLWVTAVCRIVCVLDEPDVFGFAYGTLEHHPESGEEAFLVRRSDAGDVTIEIAAVSRPRARLAKLAGPIGRHIQLRTTEKYLDGLTGC